MKRLCAVIFAFILMLSLVFCGTAFAAENDPGIGAGQPIENAEPQPQDDESVANNTPNEMAEEECEEKIIPTDNYLPNVQNNLQDDETDEPKLVENIAIGLKGVDGSKDGDNIDTSMGNRIGVSTFTIDPPNGKKFGILIVKNNDGVWETSRASYYDSCLLFIILCVVLVILTSLIYMLGLVLLNKSNNTASKYTFNGQRSGSVKRR